MSQRQPDNSRYFLPEPSPWPLFVAAGLFIMFVGAGRWLHDLPGSPWVFFLGIGVVALVLGLQGRSLF